MIKKSQRKERNGL